jgi:hypothetical protein
MFLGLAYWRLDQQRQEKKANEFARIGSSTDDYLAHAGKT